MPSAGDRRRAVGERHLLAGVVRVEAVPRAPAHARPALAAHRTPVQDHEIANRQIADVVADGFDDARGLVPEQEREVVVDAALAVMQVGVAHAARLHLDQRLARTRIRNEDRCELDWRAFGAGDDAFDLMHDRDPKQPL